VLWISIQFHSYKAGKNIPFCRIAVKCSPKSCFSTQAISGFLEKPKRTSVKKESGWIGQVKPRAGQPAHSQAAHREKSKMIQTQFAEKHKGSQWCRKKRAEPGRLLSICALHLGLFFSAVPCMALPVRC
jgi:hypothetical protein